MGLELASIYAKIGIDKSGFDPALAASANVLRDFGRQIEITTRTPLENFRASMELLAVAQRGGHLSSLDVYRRGVDFVSEAYDRASGAANAFARNADRVGEMRQAAVTPDQRRDTQIAWAQEQHATGDLTRHELDFAIEQAVRAHEDETGVTRMLAAAERELEVANQRRAAMIAGLQAQTMTPEQRRDDRIMFANDNARDLGRTAYEHALAMAEQAYLDETGATRQLAEAERELAAADRVRLGEAGRLNQSGMSPEDRYNARVGALDDNPHLTTAGYQQALREATEAFNDETGATRQLAEAERDAARIRQQARTPEQNVDAATATAGGHLAGGRINAGEHAAELERIADAYRNESGAAELAAQAEANFIARTQQAGAAMAGTVSPAQQFNETIRRLEAGLNSGVISQDRFAQAAAAANATLRGQGLAQRAADTRDLETIINRTTTAEQQHAQELAHLNAVYATGKLPVDNYNRALAQNDAQLRNAQSGMTGLSGRAAMLQQVATQGSYAIQDFSVCLGNGGLSGALIGASNNLSMMAMLMGGPVAGAIAGVAVVLIGPLINAFSGADAAAKAHEQVIAALAKQYENLKGAIQESKSFFDDQRDDAKVTDSVGAEKKMEELDYDHKRNKDEIERRERSIKDMRGAAAAMPQDSDQRKELSKQAQKEQDELDELVEKDRLNRERKREFERRLPGINDREDRESRRESRRESDQEINEILAERKAEDDDRSIKEHEYAATERQRKEKERLDREGFQRNLDRDGKPVDDRGGKYREIEDRLRENQKHIMDDVNLTWDEKKTQFGQAAKNASEEQTRVTRGSERGRIDSIEGFARNIQQSILDNDPSRDTAKNTKEAAASLKTLITAVENINTGMAP